ncbi:MAG TPA: bifunctional diguanylate cyclase/phosphodiesterase [Pseudomonas sp.]|nr:bifunctional diguanylate cyclase/phosphodiesterase [Pseudomonas sp.]
MERKASANAPESRPRLHARKLIAGTVLLFTLACVIALGALFDIANQLNETAREKSVFYAGKILQQKQESSRQFLSSYAVWNAAYQHLNGEADKHWAYIEKNVSESLYTASGYEGVFVIDDQRTKYALFKGQPSEAPVTAYIDVPVGPILEQARALAAERGQLSRYILFNGWPAILSAAAIRPDDEVLGIDPQTTSVMLFIDQLTQAKLDKLADDAGLDSVSITKTSDVSAGLAQLPLDSLDYSLQWNPPRPGDQLLWGVLPPLLGALLVLVLLMAWFLRYALRTSHEIDDNLNDLHTSNQALEASEQRFRAVAEAASDWIWETDRQHRLTYLSQRFVAVTGYKTRYWLGQPLNLLLSCDTTPLGAWLDDLDDISGEQAAHLRCAYHDQHNLLRFCRLSARPIHVNGQCTGFRGTASDITDEVAAHAHIQHLSMHDALTGLANRNKLSRFLEQALIKGEHAAPLTLILLDLDSFKPINDSLGHAAGDAVLLEVAARLREITRDGDLVARLGGDEFVLVIANMDNRNEIDRFCARLIENLHQPIPYEEHSLHIGASLGISQTRLQGFDAGELIRCADIALYQAKAEGKNTWRYFSAEMNQQIQYRRQLENDLRRAVKNHEFVLHFQPRYRLKSLQIVSVETLVRWQHPVEGLLGPDTFIPLAEQTDLIVPLGLWVLRSACEIARDWPAPLLVSVNLSPAQFSRSDVVADVRKVLVDTGFPAQRLELEITENVMLNDIEGALGTMNALKELGVRLNMDDFGTGYSSLGYLRTYPFDSIKIDKRFVAGLSSDSNDRAVVQAIINLGKAMGLTVTAEGVETEQQLRALDMEQCHEVQGFYLSRPLEREDFEALLNSHQATGDQAG